MGTQTQGKNPTFLLPKHWNPTITQNPRLFQVSEFPSKSPIFYSRNSKKALIFLSKITLETFRYVAWSAPFVKSCELVRNRAQTIVNFGRIVDSNLHVNVFHSRIIFFQKYFNHYEVWNSA